MTDASQLFRRLPRSAFPLTVQLLSPTGIIVWQEHVHDPGQVEIPGHYDAGQVATMRIEYADGSVATWPGDLD